MVPFGPLFAAEAAGLTVALGRSRPPCRLDPTREQSYATFVSTVVLVGLFEGCSAQNDGGFRFNRHS
jgi:hypothetical protein